MIGWLDGSSGASGDMLLGALVGVGVPIDVLYAPLTALDLGIELRRESVDRGGIAATKVHVDVTDTATQRRLGDIVELLSEIDQLVRGPATAVFGRLADAEAAVHGIGRDDVHFHEVGALDSIADVVGVCAGFAHLGLDALHCSTLSLGNGMTRSGHGPIPVPAPAVIELLRGIAPVEAGPAPFETTTPTGAALVAELVTTWGALPPMNATAVGVGAGSRDSDVVVNALRLVVGEPVGRTDDAMFQIEANVDDLDPRVWPEAIAAVMSAGAVDAWVTPIVMKKGRPAHTFAALCAPSRADAVRSSIFAQTSTIGMREHRVTRHVLERAESTVDVDGESIGVKTASSNGRVVNRSVEWDDVVRAATALGRPANDVLAAANRALDT